MSCTMAAVSAIRFGHVKMMLKILALAVWLHILVSVSLSTIQSVSLVSEGIGNTVMKSALFHMVSGIWDWNHVASRLLSGQWADALLPRFFSSPSFPFSPLPSSLAVPLASPLPPPPSPSASLLHVQPNAIDYSSLAGVASFGVAKCLSLLGAGRRLQLVATSTAWIVGIISRF